MPDHRGDLWIANTVSDLIQGDVHEHLPLEAIPLDGDVLGLGTTSIDNGDITFPPNAAGNTTIWTCQASDGDIRALQSGDAAPLKLLLGQAIAQLRFAVEVIADPERQILDREALQANNRAVLEVQL
jgi:hypothetical protein